MKKTLALMMTAAMLLPSAVACGGTGGGGDGIDRSKTTVIECAVHNGGIRWAWLEQAGERFSKLNENKSYADGKTGVKINITPGNGLASKAMSSEGYNIYFVERTDTYSFIASDLLMDITEVFDSVDSTGKTLEERVDPSVLPSLRGNDPDKYFVLPWMEHYSGISYDVETFDFCGSWFADPADTAARDFPCQFGTAKMVGKNGTARKSCGPDGQYGTDDDGLPSSLQELLILCQYQKTFNVEPITMSGKYIGYSFYLLASLWASIAGYEQMQAIYSFDGTEVECIKLDENGNLMFTDEPLFQGISYIKKPVTEMVPLTMENGYRSNDMAAKYYASAFLEVIDREGLMSKDANQDINHTDTEKNFLLGGQSVGGQMIARKGMLVDGSYWWVESELSNNFTTYEKVTKKKIEDRQIKFMRLPTSLNTTTTEGNGEKNTMIDTGMGVCYVNNNIKGNEELTKACIDFLKFLYTTEESVLFTEATGSVRAIDYEVDSSKLGSVFYSDLVELRQSSNVVLFTAANDNPIFKYNRGSLKIELNSERFRPTINNFQYNNFLQAYREGKKGTIQANAKICFDLTRFKEAEWSAFLKS